MTIKRSPVPPSVTDQAVAALFDELYRRRVAAIDNLPATPTTTQIATAFNALLAAMRASGAMGN